MDPPNYIPSKEFLSPRSNLPRTPIKNGNKNGEIPEHLNRKRKIEQIKGNESAIENDKMDDEPNEISNEYISNQLKTLYFN